MLEIKNLHAKVGDKQSEDVLAYLQTVKFVDMTPKKAVEKKSG